MNTHAARIYLPRFWRAFILPFLFFCTLYTPLLRAPPPFLSSFIYFRSFYARASLYRYILCHGSWLWPVDPIGKSSKHWPACSLYVSLSLTWPGHASAAREASLLASTENKENPLTMSCCVPLNCVITRTHVSLVVQESVTSPLWPLLHLLKNAQLKALASSQPFETIVSDHEQADIRHCGLHG